jgi:(p)ppGpp synthase/HD superfamily hydrolase
MTGFRKEAAAGVHEASDVLVSAYQGVAVKPAKGVPHAHAVASALRLAGCSCEVHLAGLLHDVVEDTAWTLGDVDARFGRSVAALVHALAEDDAIVAYRPESLEYCSVTP